jgi:hypothetical protein
VNRLAKTDDAEQFTTLEELNSSGFIRLKALKRFVCLQVSLCLAELSPD